MINKLIKSTILLSLAASVAFAAPALRFSAIDGDQEEKYENEFLPSLEEATGFSLSLIHMKKSMMHTKSVTVTQKIQIMTKIGLLI